MASTISPLATTSSPRKSRLGLLKTLITSVFLSILSLSTTAQVIVELSIQNKFSGISDGNYNVTIQLVDGDSPVGQWSETHNNLRIVNEYLVTPNLLLGGVDPINNPLTIDDLDLDNPRIRVFALGNRYAVTNLSSIPYAIKADLADDAVFVSANKITGSFVSTVSVGAGINASQGLLYREGASPNIGIATTTPEYPLDIAGRVNATELKIGGVDFEDTLAWQRVTSATQNIYATRNVGINLRSQLNQARFNLDVLGVINAKDLYQDGKPISAGLDWQPPEEDSVHLVLLDTSSRVGIGRLNPSQYLDINGGLRVSHDTTEVAGMIRTTPSKNAFEAYDGVEWRVISNLYGTGHRGAVTVFEDEQGLASTTNFYFDGINNRLAIGTSNPTAKLDIQQISSDNAYVHIKNSDDETLFYINASGNIGFGTTTVNRELVASGTINVKDLTINGRPIELALSRSSAWLLNENDSVYYTLGNIGIGRPDPRSLLEIAQPSGQQGDRPGQEATDPAISFSYKKDPTTPTESYTVGIDAATFQANPVFRIEHGLTLGQSRPLFSIKEGKLGLGLTDPGANLHVSGNSGMVFQGTFFGVEDETFQNVNDLGDPIPLNPAEDELFKFSFAEIEGIEIDDIEVIYGHLRNQGFIDDRGALTSQFTPGVSGFTLALPTEYQAFQSDIIAKLLESQSGRGTRMVFRPQRAAFRVGHLDLNSPLGATEWDDYNLGKFSAAFGRNSLASGNFSTVWGGENNQAAGPYATVLGGSHNKAIGFASMALGHYAYAGHHGSFVYSDNEQSTPFRSTHENQFLIRAKNGFGLQTYSASNSQSIPMTLNNQRAYFVIQNEAPTGNLMRFISPLNVTDSVMTTSGNIGFGYTGPMSDRLIVIGGMRAGKTPSPNTLTGNTQFLMTQNTPSEHIKIVYKQANIASPNFVIQRHGHAGIGVIPDAFSPTEAAGLQNDGGSIRTDAVEFPDGTQLSGRNVIVWRSPSPNIVTPDISVFYVSGNVGLGTPDPQSLMELSNFSATAFRRRLNPAITFDSNGIDIASVGVNMDSPETFLMMHGRSLNTSSPLFALTGTGVGIGTFAPSSSLHSVKPTIIEGVIRIATTNRNFALSTTSADLKKDFYVRYMNITSSGTKWIPSSNPLVAYRPNGAFIGIGTNTPNTQLEVAGTMNASSYIVSDLFKINNSLLLDRLDLRDLDDNTLVGLTVRNGNLFVGDDTNLSEQLTRGAGGSGPLGIFIDDSRLPRRTFLGRTTMDWNTDTLTIPVSLKLFSVTTLNAITTVTHNFTFDRTTMTEGLVLTSDLGHDNDTFNSESLDANKIKVHFDDNWYTLGNLTNGANPPTIFTTYGLRVNLTNTRNTRGEITSIGDNSAATGLIIDLTEPDLKSQTGVINPALFQGNVGIGKFPLPGSPVAAGVHILDVAGKVNATSFNIGERLTIATLNVNQGLPTLINPSALIVPTSGFVGINTVTPSAKLDIQGEILSTRLHALGAEAKTLVAGGDAFVVKESGFIGMGTTEPDSQLHLVRSFENRSSANFMGIGISTNFTENVAHIRGLDIALNSSGNAINILGSSETGQTATGLKVTLPLTASINNSITGLSINYPDANIANYTAAVFTGGNVGVGERTPTRMPLHVKGTMRGRNVRTPNPGSSLTALLTEQEGASFNMLEVVQDAVFSQQISANNMVIPTVTLGTERLAVNEHLNLPLISLTISGNSGTLLVSTLNVSTTLTVENGLFKGHTTANTMSVTGFSVGTSTPKRGVSIVGGTTTKRLVVSDNFTAAAMTVSTNRLVVSSAGNVGIHTSAPANNLHVSPAPYLNPVNDLPFVFDAGDNKTWNAIRLDNTSAVNNNTTGILFIPDTSNDLGIGSGILAQRVVDGSSKLLFITDSTSSSPNIRMVLTEGGQALVGTTNTSLTETLVVDGTFKSQSLSIQDILNTSRIEDIGGLILQADTIFSSTVNVSSFFLSNREVLLESETTAPLAAITGNINLYVDGNSNNGLFLSTLTSEGVQVNSDMTIGRLSELNTIPYYDATQTLADNTHIHYSTISNGTVTLNAILITSNLTTPTSSIHVVNTLANSATGAMDMNQTRLIFQNRLTGATTIGDTVFNGLLIESSQVGTQELASSELAYGLKVDLRNLIDQSRPLDPEEAIDRGYKYAGLFTGGNVLFGTALAEPVADVYIQPSSPNLSWAVETKHYQAPNYAMVVSADSKTALGTSAHDAQLTLKAGANTNTIFRFDTNAGTAAFVGYESPLGTVHIGNDPTTYNHAFDITGAIKGSKFAAADGLNSTTLNVTGQVSGFDVKLDTLGLRIGSGDVDTPLTIRHDLTTINAETYVSHETHSVIDDNLTYSLVGYEVNLNSADQHNQFGTGLTARTATGVKVDLTALSDSDMTGLSVSVDDKTAAIFMGGNVGIGTTTPTQALRVIDEIFATGNFVGATPNLTVGPIGGTDMVISGTTTVNAFNALTTITVTSSLTTALVSDLVERIDTANYLSALYVSSLYGSIDQVFINTPPRAGVTLHASSNAIAAGIVTVNGTITANNFGLSGGTGNIGMTFTSFEASGNIGANRWLLPSRTAPAASGTIGSLFVDSALDNELSYLKAGGTTKELSQNFSGTAQQLVFYDSDGAFTSEADLTFKAVTQNTNQLSIQGITSQDHLLHRTKVPETGNYTAKKITMIFPQRPATRGGVDIPIIGLKIDAQPSNAFGPNTLERMVGLYVDTTDLVAHSSTVLPPDLDRDIVGTKVAAAFLGDPVYILNNPPSSSPYNIQTGNNDAQLTIFGSDHSPFLVRIQDEFGTLNGMTITRTGNVLIGTSLDDGDLFSVKDAGTTDNVLIFRNETGPILSYTDTDYFVGLGTTTPTATLHLKQLTEVGTNLFQIDDSAQPSPRMVIKSDGTTGMGLGLTTPGGLLDVSGNFHVVNKGITPIFTDTDDDRVGIGVTPDAGFQLVTDGSMQLGVTKNIGVEPAGGLGLYSGPVITTGAVSMVISRNASNNDYQVILQSHRLDEFRIAHDSATRAILKDHKLGLGLTVTPSAKLHITNAQNVADAALNVSSNLVVQSTGAVGIGTSNATEELRVIGSLRADTILDAAHTGTIFTAPHVSVTTNRGGVTNNMRHHITVTQNFAFTAESLTFSLKNDMTDTPQKTLIGMSIVMDSIGSAPNKLDNSTGKAWGLRVDMDRFETDFIHENGNAAANKYAAAFLGGFTGLGTATPNAQLDIELTSPNGTALADGVMAIFRSTPNIIPGGNPNPGTSLVIETATHQRMHEDSLRIAVPTEALRTIVYQLGEGEVFGDKLVDGRSIFHIDSALSNTLMANTFIPNLILGASHKTVDFNDRSDIVDEIDFVDADDDGYIAEYITTRDAYRVLTPYFLTDGYLFNTVDHDVGGLDATGLLLTTGTTPKIPYVTSEMTGSDLLELGYNFIGRVGIGFNDSSNLLDVDKALVVNGDVLVEGVDSKIFFSGSTLNAHESVRDSDNNDELSMYRHVINANNSEFRISVGEAATATNNVAFKVGSTLEYVPNFNNGIYREAMTVTLYDFDQSGVDSDSGKAMLGIGVSVPSADFHVRGNRSFDEEDWNSGLSNSAKQTKIREFAHNSLVLIENPAVTANSLKILHSDENVVGNMPANSNFITFISSPDPATITSLNQMTHLGAIEGDSTNNGGVQFKSGGADYAEYLPRLVPSEKILPGDIVGVFNGKVTRSLEGAQQIMVVSVTPIIAGNWQGKYEKNLELVSFLGQVPVRVKGPVAAGDLIIASGDDDGTGVAISPDAVTEETVDLIVGQAWETKASSETGSVNTAVGFPFAYHAMAAKLQRLSQYRTQVNALQSNIKDIKGQYQSILDKQAKVLETLKEKLAE